MEAFETNTTNKTVKSIIISLYFSIQFNVPFKIVSVHMRRANHSMERKRENPEKNHLTPPQAELGLSHLCPVSAGLSPAFEKWSGHEKLKTFYECRMHVLGKSTRARGDIPSLPSPYNSAIHLPIEPFSTGD